MKRTLNGFTTYYIYDGEKPILEYRSTDLSHPAKNLYGKGIDEILMRYDPSFNPDVTYYYQQDHEGSVTHLLNTSGNVIESYKYDALARQPFTTLTALSFPPPRTVTGSCLLEGNTRTCSDFTNIAPARTTRRWAGS